MERDAAEVLRQVLAEDHVIDEGAEEAWRKEIFSRLEQIDSGAVELIPWQDAQRWPRNRL